jgi:hypothetical protein
MLFAASEHGLSISGKRNSQHRSSVPDERAHFQDNLHVIQPGDLVAVARQCLTAVVRVSHREDVAGMAHKLPNLFA